MAHKTERACDVLVVGGGMAGCAAALAARRAGAEVILAEASGMLGGCTTLSLVQPWQGFHGPSETEGGKPEQLILGIAQEFVDDLVRLAGSPGHVLDPIGFAPTLTPVNTAVLAPYLVEKLAAEGVELYFNRRAEWVGTSGDRIGAVTLSWDMREPFKQMRLRAQAVVDATGCAAIARLAQAEVITPLEPQAWTHIFVLAGVDENAVRDYVAAHTKDFHLPPDFKRRLKKYLAVSGYFKMVREAQARGEFPCPRDRLLFFGGARPGEVVVNTTRVFPPQSYFVEASIAQLRAAAALRTEALRQVHALAAWMKKRVPGFERSELAAVAPEIGIRESYRVVGKQKLKGADVLRGRTFCNPAVTAFYPIDIHVAGSGLETRMLARPYQIPRGTIVSRDYENLFAAGRNLSCDSTAFASARVTPVAMALGEAAGRLAAENLD
jgi:glycine/D-amino acid oxidase-like deaminating enzyme